MHESFVDTEAQHRRAVGDQFPLQQIHGSRRLAEGKAFGLAFEVVEEGQGEEVFVLVQTADLVHVLG